MLVMAGMECSKICILRVGSPAAECRNCAERSVIERHQYSTPTPGSLFEPLAEVPHLEDDWILMSNFKRNCSGFSKSI